MIKILEISFLFTIIQFCSPRPWAGIRPIMGVPDEVVSRVGEAKVLEGLSDDDLKAVLKEYYDK